MALILKKEPLEELYVKYNKREFVHPDPLEFLYDYDDPKDREIVALVGASLAYGRVSQILKDVSEVLKRMESPAEFLKNEDFDSMNEIFDGFKHRYTTGEEMALLLSNVKKIIEGYGSLHACFSSGIVEDDETVVPALSRFVTKLVPDGRRNSLIPSASCTSPCKRLNLFLRWMVRKDDVDPGGWDDVPPAMAIVPLDTHMHHISLNLGLTNRKQANMKAALEITEAFRTISPEDPVKYDFSLTRLGIRDDTDMEGFFKKYLLG